MNIKTAEKEYLEFDNGSCISSDYYGEYTYN